MRKSRGEFPAFFLLLVHDGLLHVWPCWRSMLIYILFPLLKGLGEKAPHSLTIQFLLCRAGRCALCDIYLAV